MWITLVYHSGDLEPMILLFFFARRALAGKLVPRGGLGRIPRKDSFHKGLRGPPSDRCVSLLWILVERFVTPESS